MRVLVFGTRTYANRLVHPRSIVMRHTSAMYSMLDGIRMGTGDDPDFVVIEGEAKGADTLARTWAETWKLDVEPYPADWNRYGKSAGFVRNKQMIEEGKPDLAVGFIDRPLHETKGSRMMASIARRAVPTTIVEVY